MKFIGYCSFQWKDEELIVLGLNVVLEQQCTALQRREQFVLIQKACGVREMWNRSSEPAGQLLCRGRTSWARSAQEALPGGAVGLLFWPAEQSKALR